MNTSMWFCYLLCIESALSTESRCASVSSKESIALDSNTVPMESISELRLKDEEDVKPHYQKHLKKSDFLVMKDSCDVTKASHLYTSGHTPVHSPIRALPFSPSQVLTIYLTIFYI